MATCLLPPPAASPSSPATGAPPRASSWPAYGPPLLVLALALVLAVVTYQQFLRVHRHLWDSSGHDRNAHYLFALKLATDVQHGRVVRLLADLDSARVWPPLYGVLAAGVMLVGGLDYRLAVLPSLAGWVGSVVLAFLVCRRALPRGGTFAGVVAALFVAASPAHRAYATDVMLESLGAGLTLAVLYAYLVMVQSGPGGRGRALAVLLTVLFLHKYNYWMLCVLAIAAAELTRQPRAYWQAVRAAFGRVGWQGWLLGQARSPLNYVLAALLVLIAVVRVRGDRPFIFGDQSVSLYPPHTLINVAYAVFFLRLAAWWWKVGRVEVRRFDGRVRDLTLWHVCPVAVWFLLPKHLGYFVWFLSPENSGGAPRTSLWEGLAFYWPRILEEYHAAPWTAWLAAGLCVAAPLALRRLRPGGQVIVWLFLFGLLMTASHPNHKGRYVHSWVALGWLTAGLGAAAVCYGRATAKWPAVRPWLAGAAALGLACGLWPTLREPGHAPEGGPHPKHLSMLDLTDVYLPELDGARGAVVVAAVYVKPLAQWTVLERYGDPSRLENNWYGYGAPGEENRQGFHAWLATTTCDTLIFLDRLPGPPREEVPEVALHAELRDLVLAQQVFRLTKRQDFPYHGCSVQVWKRVPK